jgi:hypothetical protein
MAAPLKLTLVAKYSTPGKLKINKEIKIFVLPLLIDLKNHLKVLTEYSMFRKDQITKVSLFFVKVNL